MKVLLAEDDAILQRLLQILMTGWGYDILIAPNGAAAWEAFQTGEYSLVVTDWMMPEMDGVDLVRHIRASDRPGYVYIILLTAKSQKDDIVEGMEAGADDFLTKPFDRDELRVRLRAGERVIALEQTLEHQNAELRQARELLEERVRERTADLALANEALHNEMRERQKNARELQAAQLQLIEKERERKEFYSEVVRSVTLNKVHLVDAADIPVEGESILDFTLAEIEGYRELRNQLRALMESTRMPPQIIGDYMLAVGEVVTNALKHAGGGRCEAWLTEDRFIVRITDHGGGIPAKSLAATILMPGFSTAVSMGMGYTIILQTADRMWLATGPGGTVVQLEKWLNPDDKPDPYFGASLERF